jgi:hypothetical protein
MLFKEIIAAYSENHKKPINTLCGESADVMNVKVISSPQFIPAAET